MSKKHVSRKLKSSWRKHIDTTDVDNFLEEKRQDERIGTFTETQNTELFVEEKKPGRPKATLRELRKKKFTETPKSVLSLKNTSQVRDPITKRNVKTSKPVAAVGYRAPLKLLKTVKPTAIGEAGHKDLWGNDETLPEELRSEWIGKEQLLHTMKNIGKPQIVNLPSKMDTADKIAAQTKKLPREGTSYNPTFDDYIELKNEVVDQERKLRKRKAHFDRVVTNVFGKMTAEEKYRMHNQEMSEGLMKAEEHSDQEDEPTPELGSTISLAKRRKRGSKSKKKEHFKKLFEASKIKQELIKLKDINRIQKISGEVDTMQQKAEAKALKKAEKPPQVESLPIDFIEPNLLSGNLRTVQPLNNLIATGLPNIRKISILKKSRAEAERRKTRPRKKVRYVRSSHKVANN